MEQGCKGRRGAKGVKYVISVLMVHLSKNGGVDKLIVGRETALHIAIRCGREDLVERLIQDLKADANIRDHNGDYPVHVALRQRVPIKHIKLLQGSPTLDASAKNRDGRAFTDIQIGEDTQQNILAGIPRPNASDIQLRTVRFQEPLGSKALQKQLENATFGIRVLLNDPNAPWSILGRSVDNGGIDPGLQGNEIHLSTQPEVFPLAQGNALLLEGATSDEAAGSFQDTQTYTPSISDISVEECLAGVGTGGLDGYNAESE